MEYIELPTGKHHISFSELKDWSDCSYRHKLKHVSKIDLSSPSPFLSYGTAVHAGCEHYLKTRESGVETATTFLIKAWSEHTGKPGFEPEGLQKCLSEASAILSSDEFPAYMEATFPGWEIIDVEHALYEPIVGHQHAFKGYVDAIISCGKPNGKRVIWILDMKTTIWGWTPAKKSDPMMRSQLVLYKSFWSSRTSTPMKDIRCGFLLLKRTGKQGKRCELVTVSAGDTTTKRTLSIVNNMLYSLKNGVAIKNRMSCEYCDYRNTEHCV